MTWTKCNPDDPSTYPESGHEVLFLTQPPNGSRRGGTRIIGHWNPKRDGGRWIANASTEFVAANIVGWQPLPPLPGEDRYCPECEGSGDIVPGSGCAACGGSGKYEDYVEQSGAARRSLADPLDVRPPSKGALVAELNEQSERREEAEALLNEIAEHVVSWRTNYEDPDPVLAERVADWKKRYDARSGK